MGPHSYILKIRLAAPAKKLGVSRGDAPHATAQWDQSRSSPGDSVGLAGSSREELPFGGPWGKDHGTDTCLLPRPQTSQWFHSRSKSVALLLTLVAGWLVDRLHRCSKATAA